MFVEYGDDSVAQLGGVHLACEQSSQLLAKALEWGRLAAYLEQSTRYMRYDDQPGGRWRATVPPELEHTPLADTYAAFLDDVVRDVRRAVRAARALVQGAVPEAARRHRLRLPPDDPGQDVRHAADAAARRAPARTSGIYATGQSYEQLLMRLAQHPLAEMRDYGDLMLVELRKVIPEFLKRVDQPERGVAWSDVLARRCASGPTSSTAKLVGDVDARAARIGQLS